MNPRAVASRPPLAPTHHQRIGIAGERIAAAYLVHSGFRVLERNWRSRTGELDLIVAADDGSIVAVEVKTRTSTAYGHPLEAVTARKARRLRALLYEWARAHDVRRAPLRVDAIGVTLRGGERPRIDHVQGLS